MHITSVKASLILTCETSSRYAIQALYGEIPRKKQLYANEFLIINAESGEIKKRQLLGQAYKYISVGDRQYIHPVARFNQSELIVSESLLQIIHKVFLKIQKEHGEGFTAEITINMQNQVTIDALKFLTPKLHSFYKHGPTLTTKKKISNKIKTKIKSRLITPSKLARTINSKIIHQARSIQIKKDHIFIEHNKSNQAHSGISFVDPKSLMRNLIAINAEGRSFEERLINYLIKNLKISPQTPILYQSLAVVQSPQRDYTFFEHELRAIYQLLHTYKYHQIILSLPLIRSPKEMQQIKRFLHKAGLTRSPRFKLYVSIQVPSNVLALDQFIDTDIDGLLFDTPSFVKLLFGIDTELEHFNEADFISNPATNKTIEKIHEVAIKRRIPFFVRTQDNIERYTADTEISTPIKEIKLHNMYIPA